MIKKTVTKPENSISNRWGISGFEGWFFIGVFILSVSFWFNQRSTRLSASQQLGGHTNAFYGRNVQDIFAPPKKSDYLSALTFPYSYAVQIPQSQQFVRVDFKYRCMGECAAIWIEIPTQTDAIPIRLLLRHALLHQFRYPSISGSGMTLYQREINYETIQSFIAFPPSQGFWLTERSLAELYPNLMEHSSFLDTITSTDTAPDYILTSNLKPRLFDDDWYEFSRVIDVRQATRNQSSIVQFILNGDLDNSKFDMTPPVVSKADAPL